MFNWLQRVFFIEKTKDKRIERLIKESKVRAAELAVFRETEALRLKARLIKI